MNCCFHCSSLSFVVSHVRVASCTSACISKLIPPVSSEMKRKLHHTIITSSKVSSSLSILVLDCDASSSTSLLAAPAVDPCWAPSSSSCLPRCRSRFLGIPCRSKKLISDSSSAANGCVCYMYLFDIYHVMMIEVLSSQFRRRCPSSYSKRLVRLHSLFL